MFKLQKFSSHTWDFIFCDASLPGCLIQVDCVVWLVRAQDMCPTPHRVFVVVKLAIINCGESINAIICIDLISRVESARLVKDCIFMRALLTTIRNCNETWPVLTKEGLENCIKLCLRRKLGQLGMHILKSILCICTPTIVADFAGPAIV